MKKLLESLKNLRNKWGEISKRKKIVFLIIVVAIIASLVVFLVSTTRTKYAVLFSKLDSSDAATVISKLDSDKIAHKEDSSTNTIYVPAADVDKLRLQYATNLKGGSTGFELFDNSANKFGTTDSEFNVEYQRALQGELERTIKNFDEISDARVHLVMSEDSAFVKDSTPASASVTVKMKAGETLSKDQVKAIISLVSGSVKNLPKENVQVVDDKMALLSKDLYNSKGKDDSSDTTDSAENRNKMESNVESELEKKALDSLESIYGKGKVKVKINADLNFDAQETNSQTYYDNKGNPNDPKNPTIVSQHSQESTNSQPQSTSSSPLDNNTNSNTIANNNSNSTSSSKDVTTNYDVSSETNKTVKAPGDVRRLTISVIVDGKINGDTQSTLTNVVSNAVGYNQQRGDTISVEGLPFDNTAETEAKKALKEMQDAQNAANKQKMYMAIAIGAGVLALAIITFVVIMIRRRKQAADEEEFDEDLDSTQNLDVVVGDEIKKSKTKFAPIDFEGEEDEQTHIEKEIKKYASTKPEQVVDIVKAWLTNEER
ncbi:flagellar M-ring protein FliF [Clostridium acetobutylicum]|uniref:Flagellar M-ring protein n=1 Tax=Clostridium acetobutylicum (strain ATCC 824 / DSM 792 / JCM 1419 / IAM 19013 / LMG 5710 / NBRC 13948 / NRRL B-527 / VKM B-1787 / 2291 / W) TaxID=272562 RepID=Q97H51_CLOAB|nr:MULTISPECIES: flagellar basal-body MS-ring/collar protein FliF [Clostridium]AAK80120.1 Flagellar basal body M-ring protein FliF [Clostridium acetobutylicum ATCC 824]ADZ21213.1 flagellar MS-ring protein [Clostridium acetobutylicum EA 2018]AEI34151.1 flagellar MS-ring protein [Clostridium acetobutylicum DSM 1731]AWV79455.1 flagellar basal body M-ring protein FliF [Clostridium acetobutylicum]MBC2394574.1 flagellar M-ring protein FliF [Clostridium acetobutylicum]